MNLRQAKFDDIWRKVFARNYSQRLNEVSFESLQCLADSTIHFGGGITAIVGANGVGKSTLLAGVVPKIETSG
jgi:ABC-type branched-subunit amino acid transport system ATPase component